MKGHNLPRIYQFTQVTAFAYSVLLVLYAIYNQFFHVEETWLNGFISNGFVFVINLVWILIIYIFKHFLNQILNYQRINFIINSYLIISGITTFVLAISLYKFIQIYISLEEGVSLNSLSTFATSSISGAVLLFISNIAAMLTCLPLGNKIRKIDVAQKNLFQILGYGFIGYAIISLSGMIGLLEADIFQIILKAALSILIGLIIIKASSINPSDLIVRTNLANDIDGTTSEIGIIQQRKSKKHEESAIHKNTPYKNKSGGSHSQYEDLSTSNIENHDDKELILSYFENLPEGELNRLENIVQNKYGHKLTDEQTKNWVLHYIGEKRLYDHQRFFPK